MYSYLYSMSKYFLAFATDRDPVTFLKVAKLKINHGLG